MKKTIPLLFLSALIGFCACNSKPAESNISKVPSKMLHHVVLFKFNDNLATEQIAEIEEAFVALPTQIKEIKTFVWGTESNAERDYSHCFTLGFESEEDLKIYVAHPAHQSFGEMVKGKTKAVSVLDYWTR